jgi:hypothetical protein
MGTTFGEAVKNPQLFLAVFPKRQTCLIVSSFKLIECYKMMQSVTRILWRKWAIRAGSPRTTTAAVAVVASSTLPQICYNNSRSFGATMPHSEPDPTTDWVRATIHKLLEDESAKTLHFETKRDAAPRDLDKSLERLQVSIQCDICNHLCSTPI